MVPLSGILTFSLMKKKYNRIKAFVADNWKLGVLVIATLSGLLFLLSLQLGTLTGGLSASEFQYQQAIANQQLSINQIVRDPLYLPYMLMLYLVQISPFGGPAAVRSVGVLFGLGSVIGLFYIFSKWYTGRVALLGTLLFATSSWFLHTVRYTDPVVSYLLLPLLIAAMIGLQTKVRSRLAMLGVTVFGFSMVYVPGVILFLLPAVIIKRNVIIAALRAQPLWYKGLSALVGIALISPLMIMMAQPLPGRTGVQNLLSIIGLPTSGLQSLGSMITELKQSLLDIFIASNAGPIYTPGHLPWFDIATSILVVLGLIQFIRHWRLDRSKLIAILIGLSLVLIALNGPVSSIVLMPFLFLFAVEGLKWLLNTWLQVFPKNPFARGFAIILVTVMVLTVAVFHINKYYLAWADAPETRAVFNKIP